MASAFNRSESRSGRMFVKDVTPCRAFDMYGYSVGWKCFLKIRLFNPTHVYKCADLLLSGVTGHTLQPYESHIPFILAFLADYDLYGCGWLFLDDSKLSERRDWNKTVHCGSEYDTDVTSILNRQTFEHEQRHTQVFEEAGKPISISSLHESREADARWRKQMGLKPWQPQNLQPYYQELVHKWEWERSGEFKNLLQKHIAENMKAGEDRNQADLTNVRTAADLVPSALGPSSLGQTSELEDEEVIYSQSDSDEDDMMLIEAIKAKARAQEALIGTRATSVLDVDPPVDVPRGVEAAVKEASTVLASQFEALYNSQDVQLIVEAFGVKAPLVAQFRYQSPTCSDVMKTNGVTSYVDPHFSDAKDVPTLPFRYGDREIRLKSMQPNDLPPFHMMPDASFPRLGSYLGAKNPTRDKSGPKKVRLELAAPSPTRADVQSWLERERQIAQSLSNASTKYQFASLGLRESIGEEMVTCAIEVHARTRAGKVPKDNVDPIAAVFWHISGQEDTGTASHGVITTTPLDLSETRSVVLVESEWELLEEVIKMVRYFNPDILTGYEVNASSWGYARTRYRELHPEKHDLFFEELGRVRAPKPPAWKAFASKPMSAAPGNGEEDVVKGRHLLSLWNILRKEVALSKYTLEHVVYHTLHERTPKFSYDDLNAWWSSGDPTAMGTVTRYWTNRVSLVLRLLAHFEIVNRTCEQSRITGVDFLSSLTRGSQFQVEAVMCRLSRRQNYVLISPSKAQVGQQNALEYIPLVMEPKSELYRDPVCVLDFRSLYPSVVIALNLCYSTCIGRMDLWRGHNKIGVKQNHALQRGILAQIGEQNIYVAPNGIGYVNPRVRKSLLAQMLGEILDTRFMTNETRKFKSPATDNARLLHNLYNKQLALKFIANVTYGYTSASFSGRMPCAELADSIVLAGREILQWSIRKIESVQKWGVKAQTVYGDTDSLFVRLPGVSREQAFRIGSEIADMITSETPDPILLKLEKVYDPCILLTKKRYVGHAFESSQQTEPLFDAKGIETIRRDGTPIVQKIEKRALQILFNSSDLSKVKHYLQNQWRAIVRGHNLNVQDFSFAQEVKLGHYKTTSGLSNLPGGAVVSLKKMMKDDGIEPQYRERVPFVVTAGPVGSRINDRVVAPEEMLESPSLMIDAEYYIQKVIIPPLERLLNLVGANVRDWYVKMPRPVRIPKAGRRPDGHASTLVGFLQSEMCAVCVEKRRGASSDVLCSECAGNQPRSRYILTSRAQNEEHKLALAAATCRLCSGSVPPITIGNGYRTHPCQSIDCPIYYEREAAYNEFVAAQELVDALL